MQHFMMLQQQHHYLTSILINDDSKMLNENLSIRDSIEMASFSAALQATGDDVLIKINEKCFTQNYR